MEITDIRVFLRDSSGEAKLKAYVTITLDNSFVVRNLKVIEGGKGLFVAMPSERTKELCPKCGFRNVLRSRFCNQCGTGLSAVSRPARERGPEGQTEAPAEHRDIAHPITVECRQYIQRKVLEAYEAARHQVTQA